MISLSESLDCYNESKIERWRRWESLESNRVMEIDESEDGRWTVRQDEDEDQDPG
jgi:hypothetical protein